METTRQVGPCLKARWIGRRLAPQLHKLFHSGFKMGILVLCTLALVPQVGAAVGNLFVDDHFLYTVLTEEGTTGTVSVGQQSNNISLGDVSIPSTIIGGDVTYTVSAIVAHAFQNCKSLTSIVIPDGITTIEEVTFTDCHNLTSVVIPDSVTMIGDLAFQDCDSLTSIVIPDRVTHIGNAAFQDCDSLTSIAIPASVTHIGDSAFSGCNLLTDFTVAEANPNYSSLDGVLFNKNQTVLFCCPGSRSGDYEIPQGVTTIENFAFYDCTHLTSIKIPTGVTAIKNYAFLDCDALTSVVVPDGVITLGDSAFRDCNNLTSVVIPDSVTTLGIEVFYNCSSLTSIEIPASVSEMGIWLFDYCTSLKSITVAEENAHYSSLDGVLFDKDQKTLICYPTGRSGEYVVPDGVREIGDYAFYSRVGLSSVGMPDSVITIGEKGFSFCNSLKKIVIPTSVTTIGDEAFFCCNSLTSVVIPAGVTKIGKMTFGDCENLTSVVIGVGVTQIEDLAFTHCDSLTSVSFKGNAPEFGERVFPDSVLTFHYEVGTEGWPTPWKERPTAAGVVKPEASSSIEIGTEPVVDPVTREVIGFTLTYPSESTLEVSTDLLQWEPVPEAQGGTFNVLIQGAQRRFFRYRQ